MRALTLSLALILFGAAACAQESDRDEARALSLDPPEGAAYAVFATGCFWCTEADFEKLDGVSEAISGFTGGTVEAPSYNAVISGGTGHVEAVRITYDPDVITYEDLLYHFWRTVDPFDGGGQFCDRGASYAPAIFTLNADQDALARASRQRIAARFDAPIAVRIRAAEPFWPAEAYHQDFAETNPMRYQRYRFGCGRDNRLREIWGAEAGGLPRP